MNEIQKELIAKYEKCKEDVAFFTHVNLELEEALFSRLCDASTLTLIEALDVMDDRCLDDTTLEHRIAVWKVKQVANLLKALAD